MYQSISLVNLNAVNKFHKIIRFVFANLLKLVDLPLIWCDDFRHADLLSHFFRVFLSKTTKLNLLVSLHEDVWIEINFTLLLSLSFFFFSLSLSFSFLSLFLSLSYSLFKSSPLNANLIGVFVFIFIKYYTLFDTWFNWTKKYAQFIKGCKLYDSNL